MAKQQKMKALKADGRSDWASAKFTSKERWRLCIDGLLFGCPIPGTSAVGGKVVALSNADNGLAAQIISELSEDLGDAFYYSSEARQVAKHLIDSNRAGNKVPNGGIEYAYFTKSRIGVLKDTYGLFPGREKKDLKAADAKPYDSVLVLDALYRHLRNGIAHGSFAEVLRKSSKSGKREAYLCLQDVNGDGQITARFFLSQSRVDRIISLISRI